MAPKRNVTAKLMELVVAKMKATKELTAHKT